MDFIDQQINKLRELTELDIQSQWFICPENLNNPPSFIDNNWLQESVNEKNYLVWEKGKKTRWFTQEIVIPRSLNQYPLTGLSLRIALTWWAELAQIFVNEKLVAEGDLFDSSTRILLTNNAKVGEKFLVSLKLISPKHDIGGLMIARCLYENKYDSIDPSFVANELTILKRYLETFNHNQELNLLQEQLNKIDWQNVNNQTIFNQSLSQLRKNLLPLSNYIKERKFYLLGHAHLDMAWLWEIEETYTIAQRTFNSVLNLQQDYPNLIFGHSTAYLYQWIEKNNQTLFEQIKTAIKQKKWEVLGGMWVEPEVNLISGESLARQLLYGQEYCYKQFGEYNRVAWLPDTFGFPWQLPQFLNLAEIDYFVTGKLHWNDRTKFPYGCFYWQSPDGSRIFTSMSPPNVAGVMDTNPMTMLNYSLQWETQTGLQDIFWLPGVGDHGGGPTRDMLEVAKRYNNSPFFPQIQFSTASEYLDKIRAISPQQIPVWNSELYLELHRGCYTTHSEQKFYNRYCEKLLYQAELFATLAKILTRKFNDDLVGNTNYTLLIDENNNFVGDAHPTLLIDEQVFLRIKDLWHKVLLNQFHDILPGTSITEVFITANQLWEEVIKQGNHILQQSLKAISSYIQLPNPPQQKAQAVVIFNSLNWQRNGIVELDINGIFEKSLNPPAPSLKGGNLRKFGQKVILSKGDLEGSKTSQTISNNHQYQVYDSLGNEIKTQISYDNKLLISVEQIPSIGYQVYWLVPSQNPIFNINNYPDDLNLDNNLIKVKINPNTGNLASIYDLVNHQEILKAEGNELQLFKDEGQYWDAWNIDPNYQQYRLENPQLVSIEWLEKGELRQVIRVTKSFNQSTFTQDYILNFNSPLLIIKNQVNWQETHTLLKVNFPLTISGDFATYEIACGAIKRTTKPQTEAEKAQWEVYAHHWVDLSNNDDSYGVSLLNNCKYGHDVQPNQLRLTLLRSSIWPDSQCDRGFHEFTYAVYPHQNNWQKAKTVHHGYELNVPLQTIFMPLNQPQLSLLPSQGELLNLEADNLILMALKPAEKDFDKIIIRGYECYGKKTQLNLGGELNLQLTNKVNILENYYRQENNNQINSFEIFSFEIY